MKDTSTRSRTVIKATTYQLISNTVCLGLAYGMFGRFNDCLLFTGICFVMKLVLFYYHERTWHQVRWGKNDVYGTA